MAITEVFPLEIHMAFIKGVLSVIRELGGFSSISEMAKETNEDIDDLLPALRACEMLGLIKVEDGVATLTDETASLSSKEARLQMRERLVLLEPFKTINAELSRYGRITTSKLLDMLIRAGLYQNAYDPENVDKFRKNLLAWCLKTELCDYDQRTDTWIKPANPVKKTNR